MALSLTEILNDYIYQNEELTQKNNELNRRIQELIPIANQVESLQLELQIKESQLKATQDCLIQTNIDLKKSEDQAQKLHTANIKLARQNFGLNKTVKNLQEKEDKLYGHYATGVGSSDVPRKDRR